MAQMSDWYAVTRTEVKRRAGPGVLKGSLEDTLRAVYPEYNWDTERFVDSGVVPGQGKQANLAKQLDKIEQRMGIEKVHFHLSRVQDYQYHVARGLVLRSFDRLEGTGLPYGSTQDATRGHLGDSVSGLQVGSSPPVERKVRTAEETGAQRQHSVLGMWPQCCSLIGQSHHSTHYRE